MFFECLLIATVASVEALEPMYKYRFETEDVMKTAASSIPVHGYHVVEGGYFGPRYTDTGFGYRPRYFRPEYHQGFGGGYLDKSSFDSGKHLVNGESYEKAGGSELEEGNHGKEGYIHGKVANKDFKGDSSYYNDEQGGKKVVEDGKSYTGGEHFNKEGKTADEVKNSKGHKKGHVIKGFKTSHHKDESGKTEEFYDEEHDEGGDAKFRGESGSFGEAAKSSFKGGHENGQFNAGNRKQEGHFGSERVVDKSNADQGRYDEKKSYGNGHSFGSSGGVDEHSLLGHQENSKYYKHHPYHVPFYTPH